jgi:ferric-dicitrate binding protein FerR (iron transport regulator)
MRLAEIRSQAIHWVVELDTTEHIEDLWPNFEAWLLQDIEHQRAYRHAERTWRMLGQLGPFHRQEDSRSTRWMKRLSTLRRMLRRMARSIRPSRPQLH